MSPRGKSSWNSHLATLVALCLASGWVGYWLKDGQAVPFLTAEAHTRAQLEYLAAPQSYSRVLNSMQELDALCVRLRLDIQNQLWSNRNSASSPALLASNNQQFLEGVARDIERGMREFQGTDQELGLAQDLLRTFKMAGRFDRWTEVYLQELYAHPTHSFVAQFAGEAIAVGRLTGRGQDVLSALRHVAAIPLDFETKHLIIAALMQADPGFELTGVGSSRNLDRGEAFR